MPVLERLLAAIGDEHHLALDDVDEFILERVPVPQRRLSARPERH
jgi:hypothetical protein